MDAAGGAAGGADGPADAGVARPDVAGAAEPLPPGRGGFDDVVARVVGALTGAVGVTTIGGGALVTAEGITPDGPAAAGGGAGSERPLAASSSLPAGEPAGWVSWSQRNSAQPPPMIRAAVSAHRHQNVQLTAPRTSTGVSKDA